MESPTITYGLGFDIGSSSVKASLVSLPSGELLHAVSKPEAEMHIASKEKQFAEQNPQLWWQYVCEASKELIEKTGINPVQIEGIGISYQMHGLVIVDSDGNLLRDAIIWCDSRAVNIGNEAYAKIGQDYCNKHFLNSPGNFTASKLKWVKTHEPEVYDKIHKVLLPGDYIAFRCTGQFNSTVNGLSEGVFWDYQSDSISDKLLEFYGIERDKMPELVKNFQNQGALHEYAAAELGLVKGIPIKYRAGDQPNNALALNVLEPGEVAATAGTSGVVFGLVSDPQTEEAERINHFAHVNYEVGNKTIGKLLCVNGTGILYRWLKNQLNIDSYQEMNALASQAETGSLGLLTYPFGNGAERVFYNEDVGCHQMNLNFNRHNSSHLVRSALEGIAFSFVYGMHIMKKDGLNLNLIKAGNDNLFQNEIFSQTISDLTQTQISTYNVTGSTGAARAVVVSEKGWSVYKKMVSENDFVRVFEPKSNKSLEETYQKWKLTLETKILSK